MATKFEKQVKVSCDIVNKPVSCIFASISVYQPIYLHMKKVK